MTAFWISAALLVMLALCFLVPRLVRHGARVTGLLLALLIPLAAALLYLQIGTPQAIQPLVAVPEQPDTTESLEQIIAKLQTHLQQQPDDAQAWFFLGRAYSGEQRFADAAIAFDRAAQLQPSDASIAAELAGALLLSSQQSESVPRRVGELLDQALRIDPVQQKALWLRGVLAYQAENYPAAVRDWETLASQLDANSSVSESLQQQLMQARQRLSPESQLPADSSSPDSSERPTNPAQLAKKIDVTVTIAPELITKIDSADTLFVFARAKVGPPMPLAVKRIQPFQLPITLTLDDSMSMLPELTLSSFDDLIVGARVSKAGSASPSSGDIEGTTTVSELSAVTVTIDTVRP